MRRDSQFKKLGLGEADVETKEQIVNLLLDKPRLMQRPVVVMGERAIIGRPKARVLEFLSGCSAPKRLPASERASHRRQAARGP